MSIQTSVLTELLYDLPDWRSQMYFKSSLVALSHAMEDRILASSDVPLAIATFQQERFYRQEAHRYRRIAKKTQQLYVLAVPETDFKNHSGDYETIAFEATDALAREWHLIVLGENYANCLICRERTSGLEGNPGSAMDSSRRFEGIWTSNRHVTVRAAELLLDRIAIYRPELAKKIERAKKRYLKSKRKTRSSPPELDATSPDPFVNRLVNYLQVGQHKLIKAYKKMELQEQRERSIHLMTAAIRRSLDPDIILQVAVEQLGRALGACRSLVYQCGDRDEIATIAYDFPSPHSTSLKGKQWPLQQNPFFQTVVETQECLFVRDVRETPQFKERGNPQWKKTIAEAAIVSWLLMPVLYQGRLLGMIELHYCGENFGQWRSEDMSLVEAIANQIGVALIQAEAYANLEDLNEQLEALDRTRANLVAITGHELRTPLSTIQVCLESLATEPDMSPELRQVMLNTALSDAERMRKLIQDFLTLSKLESGRVDWNPEVLSIRECIELGISNNSARKSPEDMPSIRMAVEGDLPLVKTDGEWLVEVVAKLLDNACKFTSADGEILIEAKANGNGLLEVTVADTGRGIEPSRLETVFDRFYQEEGALQRTTGGVGLGLAICRQITQRWGGKIWAESEGKDKGSQFHFTIPIFETPPSRAKKTSKTTSKPGRRSRKNQ
ncbi:MAG: GAF domain-containing protein [Cyanobacteria bacterium SBLK]|nr:GAF domain-containing protein [Cyanobacteria bacterium SBLK]